ncbi:MAG: hydrolase Nlp/P60, partial [Eggerthellaceae bacterium]|nr:hydrolase Nlp/P60 [Eggerthellaceae bacterium]
MNQFAVSKLFRKTAAALLCAFVACAFAVPALAYADTAAEKQAEAEEALAQLNAMQEALDRASADYGEALAAQEAAEEARDAARQRLKEIEAELALLQDQLGARARDMYRNGSVSVFDMLFGTTSFEDFATTWDLLQRVGAS